MEAKKKAATAVSDARPKLDLTVGITNFGPIIRGSISVKPLTVLIGPNNAGKSYAALLIRTMHDSLRPFEKGEFPEIDEFMGRTLQSVAEGEVSAIGDALTEDIQVLLGAISGSGESRDFVKARLSLQKWLAFAYRLGLTFSFSAKMRRSFAVLPAQLARSRRLPLQLTADFSGASAAFELDRKAAEFKVVKVQAVDVLDSVRLAPYPSDTGSESHLVDRLALEVKWSTGMNQLIVLPVLKAAGRVGRMHEQSRAFAILIYEAFRQYGLKSAVCHYLPAGRTGILLGNRAVLAALVQGARDPDLYESMSAAMAPAVFEMAYNLLTVPKTKGPLYELCRQFEEEFIKGEIVLQASEPLIYPDIEYRFGTTQIPLHASSSMVSELAPLILYVKYRIKPGDVLVMEEPEAHLHPLNQRRLAKFLVQLIRSGVYLIITTHSDFLLEQLNHFIMLHKVSERKRKAQYGCAECYLKPDEVGAYVFAYDKRGKGYRIDRLDVTDDFGIPEDEFGRVQEALYEELYAIEKDLSGRK